MLRFAHLTATACNASMQTSIDCASTPFDLSNAVHQRVMPHLVRCPAGNMCRTAGDSLQCPAPAECAAVAGATLLGTACEPERHASSSPDTAQSSSPQSQQQRLGQGSSAQVPGSQLHAEQQQSTGLATIPEHEQATQQPAAQLTKKRRRKLKRRLKLTQPGGMNDQEKSVWLLEHCKVT